MRFHVDSVEVYDRFSARQSSFLAVCPNALRPKNTIFHTPECMVHETSCSDTRAELTKFAKEVDESLADALKSSRKSRKSFERNVCNYKYAELQPTKRDAFIDMYGPNGPQSTNYLSHLEFWRASLSRLKRVCLESRGCMDLLNHLRNHPEDDATKSGIVGLSGSKVHTEFRLACQLGKTRSPVPNDSPVWCSDRTKLCEHESCRKWWNDVHLGSEFFHTGRRDAHAWVDDRQVVRIRVAPPPDETSRANGPRQGAVLQTEVDRGVLREEIPPQVRGMQASIWATLQARPCDPQWQVHRHPQMG
mmetsp:Transcript_20010/g.55340  ORF Transcript_20010/g.55340 Transcript_20010/m.55340 type:complete len:304 (+) Transcript_20010:200-1111(+)